MSFSQSCIEIFNRVIVDYHFYDDVKRPLENPMQDEFLNILYEKCWIDTVQWHLEDIIRHPLIEAEQAILIKRRIDASNQQRTDMVEQLDDYFYDNFQAAKISEHARINTETPAWAVDRLSILCLKIYHMREETLREDATAEHRENCQYKLNILLEQLEDLGKAIDHLLFEIKSGSVRMKLYRQMKMYNDPNLNPILYNSRK
jgi:hypothetical protein